MRHLLCGLCFMTIFMKIAFPADMDFNGEWVVQTDDLRINETAHRTARALFAQAIPKDALLSFIVNKSRMTGSLLAGENELPLSDVKVSDDQITFTLKMPLLELTAYTDTGFFSRIQKTEEHTYSFYYRGKCSGDDIRFEVTLLGNGARAWFTARRSQ